MKHPRLRRILFFAAYTAIAAAIFYTGMIAYIDRRSKLVANVQESYSSAIADSKGLLISHVEAITSDPLIQQNVDWGLNNSVAKRLQTQLSDSELDGVSLYNSDCTPLAQAKTGRTNFSDCTTLGSENGFRWYVSDGIPVLALSTSIKLSGGNVLFLQGHVALNDNWRKRSLFRFVSESTTKLEIASWTPAHTSFPIVIEGPNSSGAMVASLIFRPNIIDAYLGEVTSSKGGDYRLAIGLLIFALVILISIQSSYLNTEHTQKTTLAQILGKLHKSLPSNSGSASTGELSIQQMCLEMQTCIEQINLQHEAATTKLLQKIKILGEEKAKTDGELTSHTARIGELSHLESLSQQLSRSCGFMVNLATTIQELAQDLNAILIAGLETNSNFITDVMTNWQKEIRLRGSRKFIRSMSETTTATPGLSILDEQLQSLSYAGLGLADQAIAARLHSAKLVDRSTRLYQLADQWQDFIEKKADGENLSLHSLVTHASILIQADDHISGWHLSTPKDNRLPDLSKLPVRDLAAAIYHAVIAIAASTEPLNKPELSLHFRKKGDHNLILLTLPRNLTKRIIIAGKEAHAQLELIRRLLAPYGISCDSIDLASGYCPISFRWKDSSPMGIPPMSDATTIG